ncbi:Uncharacterised protein [uncultured archaeon]|nr:Uncharacterised protein [uncultured archaeon]
MQETDEKVKQIEEGLSYLTDLGLLDEFYEEVWRKSTIKFLDDKFKDESEYYDIPLEETEEAKQHVIEWFGVDYGLAKVNCEYCMVSVGSIDEGGNKWWYKIKLKTDDQETARKVILLDKCLPGKYCNILH